MNTVPYNQLPPTVSEMGKLHFEGNITPHSWYDHITFPSGKADLLAITLLSDVVYWYRPTEVRDERSGALLGFRQKFSADKLQRSYQAWAEKFGVSKLQVKRAVDRLKAHGLLVTEFRTITTVDTLPLANVLFISPVPQAIERITFTHGDECSLSLLQSKDPSTLKSPPPSSKVKTYTKITSKSTSKITTPPPLLSNLDNSTTDLKEFQPTSQLPPQNGLATHIFTAWNTCAHLQHHRAFSSEAKKKIGARLKQGFVMEDFLKAFDCYNEILRDTTTYYMNYKWTLSQFVASDRFESFLTGEAKMNYKRNGQMAIEGKRLWTWHEAMEECHSLGVVGFPAGVFVRHSKELDSQGNVLWEKVRNA